MGGSDARIEGDLRQVQNALDRLSRADLRLDQIERLERYLAEGHVVNLKKISVITTELEERRRRHG